MNVNDIDIAKVQVEKPKDLKSKGWILNITYNGEPLRVQTPVLSLTYDTAAKIIPDTDSPGASLTASLPDDPSLMGFKEFLQKLHAHVQSQLKAHSKQYFGEQDDFRKLPSLIKACPPDKNYSPTFVAKLAFTASSESLTGYSITTPLFNKSKDMVNAEENLTRGSKIIIMLKVSYVHVQKKTLTATIRVDAEKVLLISTNAKNTDFDFNLAGLEDPVPVTSPVQETSAPAARVVPTKRELELENKDVNAKKAKTTSAFVTAKEAMAAKDDI